MNNKFLDEKMDFYRNSLIYLEYLKNDIIFISNRKEDYFKEIVYSSSFFERSYKNSIKLFVLELYKILENKEHYNLQSFLNNIINNKDEYNNWYTEPDINIMIQFRNKVSAISKSEDYKKIKNLRNKYYAHSDSNRDNFKTDVPFHKLWIILDEIQKIFCYLNLHLNKEQFIFSLVEKEIREIKLLQKHKRINKYVNSELRKSPDIGKLQEIRNIMLNKTPKQE
ncbi:hypothetical protein BW723_07320 [Polaribacter reichenbachii]|uniref:HEPN AbiU2-like domain-containing protein n=1 Tax=Polaribacter reichenbachii TaxID=996801 RepID=A0A1B8U6H0_9FLAO|nr:hypothetical protein [Polaribacter reichenbachii]APZ46118.1 hypothetical protein BW723_07320 [Polaribacter reichenbachii]AUC19980.1 hypothetical protein BTO17_15340 [Polaribacter reichenbachii]OBY67474.1 hypothetical protein LPB301_02170 [Polaribacter reichenbachii]